MSSLSQQEIDQILKLIDASTFEHFKLEMGDLKLELSKQAPLQSAAPVPVPAAAAVESAPLATVTNKTITADSGVGSPVPAPLLGTFYHAPKPGAAPFVQVGDTVNPDTVIGIIEVMKLMNSVTAGVSGTVSAIVAPDGQLVEHGDTLIRVAP